MATNDGKIYIIVTDKLPGGGGILPVPTDTDTGKKEEKPDMLKQYAFHKMVDFTITQAKKAINFELSHVGDFTGNYEAQQDINNVMEGINFFGTFVAAGLAGFKAGGVPGAVIGSMIAIGGAAINYFQQEKLRSNIQAETNRKIKILQQRSGLNANIDGSRGTEN